MTAEAAGSTAKAASGAVAWAVGSTGDAAAGAAHGVVGLGGRVVEGVGQGAAAVGGAGAEGLKAVSMGAVRVAGEMPRVLGRMVYGESEVCWSCRCACVTWSA